MFPAWANEILRGGAIAPATGSTRRRLVHMAAVLMVFGFLYGAAMGSFWQQNAPRPLQMFFSGVKVPLLLLVTFSLSLPFFFVLNSLLGLREDFKRVLLALLTTQAALTVILASFAPLTLTWYCSSADYPAAILCNALMFAVASLTAQVVLRHCYRPLIGRNPLHRRLLKIWLLIYAFIGIQMSWVLRPFIGDPGSPVQFFRENAWGNAYIKLAGIIGQLFQ